MNNKVSNNNKPAILVSACLLGVNCNYKGGCSYDFTRDSRLWISLNEKYTIIPICPEQLGGLSTPRIPSELIATSENILNQKGQVISREGTDVTANFVKGAKESARFAELYNVQFAVLKSKSPSCGVKSVYDGSFGGVLVDGMGITACLLKKMGIMLFDENDFADLEKCTLSDYKVEAGLSKLFLEKSVQK